MDILVSVCLVIVNYLIVFKSILLSTISCMMEIPYDLTNTLNYANKHL